MRKKCYMPEYECDDCDFSTDNVGKYSAHRRWEHENTGENRTNGKGNPQKHDKTPSKPSMDEIEVDNSDFMGVLSIPDVKDYKTPKARCSNCGNPVKPGTNCQDCGAELNWSVN